MSFKHQQYAKHLRYTNQSFSLAEKEVLNCIADHCNGQTNEAWPAVSTLAREANVSDRTVIRAIDTLTKMNILSRMHTPGKRNTLYFPIPVEFDEHARIGSDNGLHAPTLAERADAALRLHLELTGMTMDQWEGAIFAKVGEAYSVPGVDDPAECRRIHTDLVSDPQYGDTPGQRITNAILHGQHPNWGGNSRDQA